MKLRPLSGLIFLLPAVFASAAQDAPAPLFGMRSLAISPDGKRLCFYYQGDLWVGSVNGGKAMPITSNVDIDDNPVWSPDSQKIAFSSNRNGNNDVYWVSADGGMPRRLTYFSGSDIPSDWSPDGKSILLRSTRDDNNNGIYEIDAATGKFRALFFDQMTVGSPKYSPDGGQVLYSRLGFPWSRPRYSGSGAAQIWTFDRASKKRTALRNNELQHLWTNWSKDGIFTVTMTDKVKNSHNLNEPMPVQTFSAAQTPNVYKVDLSGKAVPVTKFGGNSVRWLTSARDANVHAFEMDGSTMVIDGAGTRKVEFIANVDDKSAQESRQVVTTGADSMDVSPNGETVAFTVRNDIWTIPVTKKGKSPNKDDANRLTVWEGFDEQPLWAPDGKSMFIVSDRDGTERLYRLNIETKETTPITKNDADVSSLKISPDKKLLTFWMTGKNGGLYSIPVEGREPKLVLSRPGNSAYDYDWSPDMRYVAYAEVLNGSGYYYWESARNIVIFDVAAGKGTNVTQLNAQHFLPRWSPDGRYLFFGSNRQGDGLYVLPLVPEDLRPGEVEMEYKKPSDKTPVKVEIDFNGIQSRVRRLVGQDVDGNLLIDPETGVIYFGSEGDIWRADFNGEGARRFTNGGGVATYSFGLTPDGKSLQYIRGGSPNIQSLRVPNNPINTVAFRADWTQDLRNQRKAAFVQFWREFNRGFYDPYFHGRDWRALRNKYERYVPTAAHPSDLSTILNMMVGELESSHSEVSGPAGGPPSQQSANLGFTFDYGWEGKGIKIKSVPNRAPGSFAKTKLEAGEVVTQINGKPVQADEALYRDVLNEQIGRELTLTVMSKGGETRTVKYRALSTGEFNALNFQNLLEQRRRYVEEKSGGKLTYVHIAGMSQGELDRFVQQAYQYGIGKQGMIIDVRNNGGGNTSDRIIDLLERKPNAYYQVRDEAPIIGPGQLADFPLTVMCAQTSFSNAEMFPNSMRTRGLAKLVGMPTPGYVIYTGGFPLVDGTVARMPGTGVYRLNGTPLENMGVVPDITLENDPVEFLAGIDRQLDKAIADLLSRVKG
jgi:Tol biopolymer transport system component/C-terminal processing protease CtpA/Prc